MTHFTDYSDEDDPKHKSRWFLDYLATFWLFSMVVPGAWIAHEYINPVVFKHHPTWRTFNEYFLYYGCFMLTINWLLIKFTNTAVPKWYRPSTDMLQFDENHFCKECDRFKPPRSHHCNLCKKCIAKQDHHCFFVGTCVGNNNQRFFVVFTFWMGLGFFYCCFVAFWYVKSDEWRQLGWYDYFVLPLSIIRYFLGYLSTYELFCLFLFHSLGIATYASNFILVSQMYLICKGLTSWERKKGLRSPAAGYSWNTLLEMTFGRWWLLNFILPIGLFTKPYGDGCDWSFLKFRLL